MTKPSTSQRLCMANAALVRSLLVASLLTIATACGGGSDLGECPPGSTQQQNTGASIVFTTCVGCHSSQLTGAGRFGAPVGMDFDDIEIVRDLADDVYGTAADGSMPPPNQSVSSLNDAQVEAIRVYLACGAEFGSPNQ